MDVPRVLRLEVQKFRKLGDLTQWHWTLKNAKGEFLGDREVRLPAESLEYKAMTRLQFYARWKADPERPIESEVDFIGRVGRWMGEQVFGDIGPRLVRSAPVTALVVVPPDAAEIRHWPLELAWAREKPLALQGVSLLFDVPDDSDQASSQLDEAPIGRQLRMLAVFSLPAEEPLLLLSQQRYELVRSIGRIAARKGYGVSLVTVQHGVTKERLGEILEQEDGWDVIHFSGHGLSTGLLLEGTGGKTDLIAVDELLEVLRSARGRLKLLVLSSCESGAAAWNEAIRVGASQDPNASENLEDRKPLPALAVEAARQLECAVLGMRYRVSDDFSILLARHLYNNLFDKRNLLPKALQLALRDALKHWPEPGNPPLSVAMPALFGQQAADLRLVPPAAEPSFAPGGKMSYFNSEPELFVGRVESMAAASRALSPESRYSGVLFHAPGPTGKTASAVELAYLYKDQFSRLVLHRAPTQGNEIARSLVELAESLETQLEMFGQDMGKAVRSLTELQRFLPKLRNLMKTSAILVCIDGIEALLTTDGDWRNDMWRLVVNAMLDHDGLSKLVLTSRRPPAELHDRLCVIPVPTMSPEEALLLARQLPHLGDILRGRTEQPMGWAAPLIANTLAAARGMPGIIHKADEQLTSPGLLGTLPAKVDELAHAAGLIDETGDGAEEYRRLVDEYTWGIRRSPGTSAPNGPLPSPGGQIASAPRVPAPAVKKPRPRKTGGSKKPLSAESASADHPVPQTGESNKFEGESKVPEVPVLPDAVGYHSELSDLVFQLNALENIPQFPRGEGGESTFEWQFLTESWLTTADSILTDAVALAAAHESRTYPSVRLAQSTADAKAGLKWIRQLVAHAGTSADSDQFPRRCEEAIAAISDIVAFAAGS